MRTRRKARDGAAAGADAWASEAIRLAVWARVAARIRLGLLLAAAIVPLTAVGVGRASTFSPPAGGPRLVGEYIGAAPGAMQFSMLVRSERRRAPLVVYLAGGPGASSVATAFLGSGPWSLSDPFAPGGGGGLRVTRNRWSWNRIANVVYLDQPRYSGYSTGSAPYVTSMSEASSDFVGWLDRFLARHPDLARRPLFLAGESFAGQYVPAFARAIMARPAAHRPHLAGLLLASPQLRVDAYPARLNLDFLCDRGLLAHASCAARPGTLTSELETCVEAAASARALPRAWVSVNEARASNDRACNRFLAETEAGSFPHRLFSVPESLRFPSSLRGQQVVEPIDGAYFRSGGLVRTHVGYSPNPWNTAFPCRRSGGYPPWCYDDRRIERFFNDPAVRRWIGAARLAARQRWRFAQWPVALTFLNSTPSGRTEPSFEPFVAALRMHLPVSIVVGDDDYAINPYAVQWYVNEIARGAYGVAVFPSVPARERSMHRLQAPPHGQSAGRWTGRGLLRYGQFVHAGHEAILAHPRAAFDLLADLIRRGRPRGAG
jgi:Serine carboxypeptidase